MFVYRVRVVKCCIASHGVSVFSFFSPILNPPTSSKKKCVMNFKELARIKIRQLPEFVFESSGPYCIYPLSRGHYWTDV